MSLSKPTDSVADLKKQLDDAQRTIKSQESRIERQEERIQRLKLDLQRERQLKHKNAPTQALGERPDGATETFNSFSTLLSKRRKRRMGNESNDEDITKPLPPQAKRPKVFEDQTHQARINPLTDWPMIGRCVDPDTIYDSGSSSSSSSVPSLSSIEKLVTFRNTVPEEKSSSTTREVEPGAHRKRSMSYRIRMAVAEVGERKTAEKQAAEKRAQQAEIAAAFAAARTRPSAKWTEGIKPTTQPTAGRSSLKPEPKGDSSSA
ncbi:MAG: hypothetical protein Q9216_003558 [Gyalolechia sp. 2 TL-2023]